MKKLLLPLFIISVILINSCSEDSTSPKEPCTNELNDAAKALYDTPPDACACIEGVLKMSEKLKAMDRLNYIRRIHGLSEVSYNTLNDLGVQQSALISAANDTIVHFPPKNFSCYTGLGDTACQQSNLHFSWSSNASVLWKSEASIDGWINEEYSASIGHRRWFLSPFLKSVSYGRVDKINKSGEYFVATTMHVFDNNGPAMSSPDFVACPYHDYPRSAFDTGLIMSFTTIADKSSIGKDANSEVKYTGATIEIKDDNQNSYQVYNVKSDNIFMGVPNCLEWRVKSLNYDTRYNVTIKNVTVNDQKREFTYWFNIK